MLQKNNSFPGNKLFLLSLLLLFPFNGYALSEDSNKPINIKADSVTINEKTGISIYTGNVVFTQGSLVLNGSKIVIHQPDGSITKILVNGNPARFQQEQDDSPDIVHAKAEKMKYVTKDERVYLSKNASVWQGDNLLKGNEIEYNTRNSTVTAQKSSNNTNRVHVVIEPEKKEPE